MSRSPANPVPAKLSLFHHSKQNENKKYSDSVLSGIAPRIRLIKAISVNKPIDKCVIGKTRLPRVKQIEKLIWLHN